MKRRSLPNKEASIPYVSVVERSGDRKLTATGNVSATWAAQQSCPDSCPLRNNGCYAELNKAGFQTWRLNREAARRKQSKKAIRNMLAKLEAAGIRKLSGKRKLRVHVVGDCPTPAAARLVGSAMISHERKQGMSAWTYTHAWREVPLKAWQGARVLASCNSVKEVKEARRLGYGTAVIVPPHPSNKVYELAGEKIIPCPAQFKPGGRRVVTCEHCTLCMRPDFLRDNRLSIGFQPDGGSEKRIIKLLNST